MSTLINKRAVLAKACEPLVIEEKEIHPTPAQGLVIKTRYAGICHSDVHLWEDEMPLSDDKSKTLRFSGLFYQLPIVLGHEVSGEVHSIGNEVTRGDLKVGDKVVIVSWQGCKQCEVCKSGAEHMCDDAGRYYLGCSNVEGGFQSYVALKSANDVIKVPDCLPMDVAALAGCSGLTAYNALTQARPTIDKFLELQGQASVLIIGTGGLGIWGIKLAKAVLPGTCKIVCADISEEKVALGKDAGADDFIVWPIAATDEEIKENTGRVCPKGFHAVLDFVNSPVTIGRGFQFCVTGAVMCQVGLFGGSGSTLPLGLLPLKAVNIRGIKTGNHALLKELLETVASYKVQPPPIKTIPLEEAHEYLMRLREGKVQGRTVIDFTSS